jgi:hypothetical protein
MQYIGVKKTDRILNVSFEGRQSLILYWDQFLVTPFLYIVQKTLFHFCIEVECPPFRYLFQEPNCS